MLETEVRMEADDELQPLRIADFRQCEGDVVLRREAAVERVVRNGEHLVRCGGEECDGAALLHVLRQSARALLRGDQRNFAARMFFEASTEEGLAGFAVKCVRLDDVLQGFGMM